MLRKKLRSPRIWLWIAGITLGLAVVIGGMIGYFSRKWKPVLDSRLKQLVLSASDSLYRVEYSRFDFNLITGNAEISNARLIPDWQIYQKLLLLKKAPDHVYDLQVANISIQNFHPKQLYSDKKLNINSIIIDKPSVQITNRRQPYNDTLSLNKPQTFSREILKLFKLVSVNQLILRDVNFTFDNRNTQPYRKTVLKNLNASVSDILIDSLSGRDKNRIFFSREISLSLKDYHLTTPDSLYRLNFSNLRFSTAGRQLAIDSVRLIPRLSKTAYYKKVGFAKDRFRIRFNNISLSGIDMDRFSLEQKVYARKMDIGEGNIEVYNNRAYKRNMSDKTGKFPHQQLQKLALVLKIDTLSVKNTDVSYAEFNAVSKQTGKITFNHAHGTFLNVTNDAEALQKNHLMTADLNAVVFNAGKLSVHFNFNLTSREGNFAYSGQLKNMNGVVFNNITKPLGLLEIRSLWIDKLDFDVKANSRLAQGALHFYYKDLSVEVLKKNDESGRLAKQGLISGVANVFVIRDNNPDPTGKFTPGTIYYHRLYYQSFFGFIWKSLFSGIKESAGVSKEKEKKIRKTVKQVGSFIEKMKEKIAERKAVRQEKREDRKKKKDLKKAEKDSSSQ